MSDHLENLEESDWLQKEPSPVLSPTHPPSLPLLILFSVPGSSWHRMTLCELHLFGARLVTNSERGGLVSCCRLQCGGTNRHLPTRPKEKAPPGNPSSLPGHNPTRNLCSTKHRANFYQPWLEPWSVQKQINQSDQSIKSAVKKGKSIIIHSCHSTHVVPNSSANFFLFPVDKELSYICQSSKRSL